MLLQKLTEWISGNFCEEAYKGICVCFCGSVSVYSTQPLTRSLSLLFRRQPPGDG